jgi:prepilin-type processing-associated H-X9-DG protein
MLTASDGTLARELPMRTRRMSGFTIVELFVVLAIMATILAIVVPAASKLQAQADTDQCLANLSRLSLAFLIFAEDHHGFLPYPTAPHGNYHRWAGSGIEMYLSPHTGGGDGHRPTTFYEQCPLVKATWAVHDDNSNQDRDDQTQTNLEIARSYKMNANLRHWVGDDPDDYIPATVAEILNPEKFVMIGDGISVDYFTSAVAQSTAPQFDNSQFCMDVNMPNDAGKSTQDAGYSCPALRHYGLRCNIAFVDGHAETLQLPTMTRLLSPPGKVEVKTFQTEFLTASGQPAYLSGAELDKSSQSQGLVRNPNMPLYWTQLPTLRRP